MPLWTYLLEPTDDPVIHLTQYATADNAEAVGAIRRSRGGVEIPVDIHYGDESDGALAVELPSSMMVTRVDPPPHHVARVHGHPVLAWTGCAALPQPTVVAHFR